MIFRFVPRLSSVKAKLFTGFLAMSVLIAGVGGYALLSVSDAGRVVEDTFDRPLMAVNFARSASQAFASLEILRLKPSDDADGFTDLAERFRDDLAVARERSIEPRAQNFFDAVEADYAQWEAVPPDSETTASGENQWDVADRIEETLDIIVELQTNESFRNREAALTTMSRIRQYSLYAVGIALALTLVLSAWLTLTIVRPLKAAASAAAQISGGRLDVTIPESGDDETGQLLRTMSEMQDRIRLRMQEQQDMRTLAQNRLSETLENSADAVLLTDARDRITVANPRVSELFAGVLGGADQPMGQLTGRACAELFGLDGVPDGITAREGSEFSLPGGCWLRVSASKTREGGRLLIWSDVTDARRKSETLKQARDEAEAASRAKTLFLAAMSHELNTPLNAVVGLADVLKTELARPGLDPSFADMVGLIGQSGEHISRIVSDVLEIADGDSAPVALDRLDPADLGACVQAAVDAATPHAKSNGVRIGWDRPQAGIGVLFDPQELTQSVGKLLDNAVKFNRPGGAVKLRLLPADPATGAPARLDVADTGIGIPADQLERIREPFVQVDQGYSRAVDGTGLGLCIVDRSATRHGARLHIHSVPDRGSVFSLLFAPTPNSVSGSVSASDPATDTPSERLDTAA